MKYIAEGNYSGEFSSVCFSCSRYAKMKAPTNVGWRYRKVPWCGNSTCLLALTNYYEKHYESRVRKMKATKKMKKDNKISKEKKRMTGYLSWCLNKTKC